MGGLQQVFQQRRQRVGRAQFWLVFCGLGMSRVNEVLFSDHGKIRLGPWESPMVYGRLWGLYLYIYIYMDTHTDIYIYT